MTVFMRRCIRCREDKPAVGFMVKEVRKRICKDCRLAESRATAKERYEYRAKCKRLYEKREREAALVRIQDAGMPNEAFMKRVGDVNAILDDWLVDLIDSRGYLGSDRQAKALRALLTEYKSFTRSNRNELLRMNRVLKVVRDDKRLGTMNAIEGRAKNQQRAVWALRCVAMDIMQDKSAWGEFTDYYHRN